MPETPTSRVCWRCKQEKPLDFFSKDKYDSLGHQKACKVCQRAVGKAYAEDHPEYFKAKGKERYNPAENPARYKKHRKVYLERHDRYLRSVAGRLKQVLASARERSARLGREYDLDFDWIQKCYTDQNGCCALTGIKLTLDRNPYGERFYLPFSPSLDRINSEKGYTKDNTRLVCVVMNLALNRFGEDVFKQVATAYLERHP